MTYNEYASMADFMFETVDRRDVIVRRPIRGTKHSYVETRADGGQLIGSVDAAEHPSWPDRGRVFWCAVSHDGKWRAFGHSKSEAVDLVIEFWNMSQLAQKQQFLAKRSVKA